jgi:NADPH-dependent ferric siderophore reductase
MLRVGFTSNELSDFASASPDDHIKIHFPAGDVSGEKPCRRDFTPRTFDTASGILTVDFVLHKGGPATEWAAQASIGQTLEIGGPGGSVVVPDDFDWYLLIGDESALPAFGRRLEELRPGVPVTTVVAIADENEAQTVATRTTWTPIWVSRAPAHAPSHNHDDEVLLRSALSEIELPHGDGFIWIAAEASAAKALRTYIIDERGHPKGWVKAMGFWQRGIANAHHVNFKD